MKRTHPRRHGVPLCASGFSLLETLMAGAIFLVAMLGVVSAVSTATTQYQHQRNATIALQVAERTMEELLLEYSTSTELNEGTHTLDVGVPTTLGASVGVGDAVPEAWALTADVAVSRHRALLSCSGQIPLAPVRARRPSLVLDAASPSCSRPRLPESDVAYKTG